MPSSPSQPRGSVIARLAVTTASLLLAFGAWTSLAGAGPAPAPAPAPTAYNRDGAPQSIWLVPNRLAMFPLQGDTQGRRFDLERVRKAAPTAEIVQVDEGLLLITTPTWRTRSDVEMAAAHLAKAGLPAYGVFSTTRRGDRLVILTGRVIVRFRQGHDRSGDAEWARRHGLTRMRAMPGGRSWLYYAGIGLTGLTSSKHLDRLEDVESASPDWVHSMQKKVSSPP